MIKVLPRMRRKKIGVPKAESYFTAALLTKMAEDLQKRRVLKPDSAPHLKRTRIRDDMVVGLHATINHSGLITFHIDYDIGGIDHRYHLLLGSLNEDREDYISVEKARERAKTIKALAAKGVNPQEGLHMRLWRELDERGTAWKPGK
jgi:hypothetical protein